MTPTRPRIAPLPLAAPCLALPCLVFWALAGLAVPAAANVDVEIDAKAKVKGTLEPAGEEETLRFTATRGATLALVLAAKKKAPLDFDVELRAPDDAVVDLSAAPKFVDKGSKVTVKKLVLPQTGEYRLIVRATGEGEYAAKVTVAAAKKVHLTVGFQANEQRAVNLAVPNGSKVTLTAKSSDGTAPRFDSLGPTDLSTAGSLRETSHTVKKVEVVTGGEVPLTMTNRAAVEGDGIITAKITAPKVKTLKLDLRGDQLGKAAGGETAVSRTIDATAGGLVEVLDLASDIAGVAVDIPGGALPSATRITISSSPDPQLPDPGSQGAGPAVFMGPEGTEFANAATITLRFDPNSIPIGVDPFTELSVVRVKADGTTETIVPTSIDLDAGTMTLPTSGFSTFQPIVPEGLPNLTGKDYWSMSICFTVEEDFQRQSGDSRIRYIDGDLGRFSFGTIGAEDGVSAAFEIRDRNVDHDDQGNGIVTTFAETEFEFGSWRYDGNVVTITDNDEVPEVSRLVPSADGHLLAGEISFDPSDNESQLGALLRAHEGPLSMSQVAGTYNIAFFSIGAHEQPSGPARLTAERAFGSLTIRTNGSASVRFDARFTEFDSGAFAIKRETVRETGTVSFLETEDESDPLAGALLITFDDEEAPELVLLPGQDMGAFLGGTAGSDDSTLFLMGVRQQTGFSRADAAGVYVAGGMDVETTTYDLGGMTIPDFVPCSFVSEVSYMGGNALDILDLGERCVFRETNVVPEGVFIEVDLMEEGGAIPVSIAKNGTFTLRGDDEVNRGAFGPNASFGFVLQDPGDAQDGDFFGMTLLVRPPLFMQEQLPPPR